MKQSCDEVYHPIKSLPGGEENSSSVAIQAAIKHQQAEVQ
jgi:hypothetical protein